MTYSYTLYSTRYILICTRYKHIHVSILKHTPHIHFMHRIHIEFETLGNTVLEAFSCGIPVVVPRTQGFCDTVSDQVNGYLFEPRSVQDCQRYVLYICISICICMCIYTLLYIYTYYLYKQLHHLYIVIYIHLHIPTHIYCIPDTSPSSKTITHYVSKWAN